MGGRTSHRKTARWRRRRPRKRGGRRRMRVAGGGSSLPRAGARMALRFNQMISVPCLRLRKQWQWCTRDTGKVMLQPCNSLLPNGEWERRAIYGDRALSERAATCCSVQGLGTSSVCHGTEEISMVRIRR
uniref:Uncharacterized protein n=1 Tax=Oryza nivara TaxID=4536 RepID=A0A0E0H959_ORYNI